LGINEWLYLVGLIISVLGSVLGVAWRFSIELEKRVRERDSMLTRMDEEVSEKINRVYERIDDVKRGTEQTFVRREVCELVHRSMGDQFAKLEKTIDEIRSDVKALLIVKKNTKTKE
jgi:hypothetical protein